MTKDRVDIPPPGDRRLPRRAIITPCRISPAETRKQTRQDRRLATPTLSGHAGTSKRGVSPLTSGESARFPPEPRAKREASAASLAPSIKRNGQCSLEREVETRTSEDRRIESSSPCSSSTHFEQRLCTGLWAK